MLMYLFILPNGVNLLENGRVLYCLYRLDMQDFLTLPQAKWKQTTVSQVVIMRKSLYRLMLQEILISGFRGRGKPL